jgi:MFS family permease
VSIPAPRLITPRAAGIAAAIGAISVVGTALSLAMPLLSLVLAQRGVANSVIGLLGTAGGVAAIACTPFVPRLARRFGTSRVLLANVLMATAVLPLFYVFESLPVWFVLRFVLGICLNVAFVLSEFWMNALAPPERRGLVLGIYGTVLSVGFAVGPFILSLSGADGFLPFAIGTALLAFAAVPVAGGLFADQPVVEGESRHVLHFVAVVPIATLAALTMGAFESAVMNLSPVYGLGLGYDEKVAALLVASVAVGNICSQVPLGLLADRMDRRRLLVIIAGVGAVTAPFVALVSSMLVPLIVTMAIWGGTAAGLYSVGLTHLGARLSGAELASANAAFLFMYSVGMLVGPALAGFSMDTIGPHGFVALPALMLAAYTAFGLWRIRREDREAASPS